MKKFKEILCLLLFCIVLWSCKHTKPFSEDRDKLVEFNNESKISDTVCSFHKLSITYPSKIFLKIKRINYTFLSEDKLYMLSTEGKKIFILNLVDNSISEPKKLNNIVDSVYSKYSYPVKLYVDSSNVFIGFNKGFIDLDKNYNVKYQTKTVLNQDLFEMFSANRFAIVGIDSISIYDRLTGYLNNTVKTDSNLIGLNYIKSNDGMYGDFNALLKLSYVKDSIIMTNKFLPDKLNGIRPFQDMYIAFVGKNYVIWFLYGQRKKMIITNIKMNRIIKIIPFDGFDLSTDSDDEINTNERYLDFSIDLKGDNFYITRYKNHSLSIFGGCVGTTNKSN